MATTYSTQMTNERATPQVINAAGAYVHRIPWDYTIATTALANADIVQICTVPAGCRVLLANSVMKVSATTGPSTSMDMGHAAYKDKNSATIAASADALVNGYVSTNLDVVSLQPLAGAAPAGTGVNNLGVMDFSDAVEEVTITLTCNNDGGTFDGDIGDIWEGYLVVEMGGN